MSTTPVRLDTLIAHIHDARPEDDALARVEAACQAAADLDQIADHLIGHFVDEARDAGFTWTQIGEHIGVTKQAARKRFAPREVPDESVASATIRDSAREKSRDKVFGRYTDRARHAVVLAQENARDHGHPFISTEHILFGICQEDHDRGAQTIEACGVELADLQTALTDRLPAPSAHPRGHIPFAQEGKKALDLAMRASLLLGHDWIGTEHLLLGLLTESTGLAAQVLGDMGITAERAQEEALKLIGS